MSRTKKIDLIGQRFGRLTVIEELEKSPNNGNIRWLCRCDCGNEKITTSSNLRYGSKDNSCGCSRKEKLENKEITVKHPLYKTASNILSRCNNPNHDSYPNYGGRGIKCLLGDNAHDVCLALSHVSGWEKGLEIDRIDVNGHYEIGNLRWVNHSENNHNQGPKKNNRNGVRGVYKHSRQELWAASMMINRVMYREYFPTFEDAVWHRQSLEEYYYLKQFIKNGYEVGVQK